MKDPLAPTETVPWAVGTLFSTITAAEPPGNASGSFIVTNDNNALFSVQPAISANGTLTYTLASGPEVTPSAVAHVSVALTTGGVDTSAAQSFTITEVNVAPSAITLSNSTVQVSAPTGSTVVGNLATNDPGGPTDNHFAVTTDSLGAFTVNGSQQLVANNAQLVGHTTDTITIQDTDSAGAVFSKSFNITIQNVQTSIIANNDSYNDFHLPLTPAALTVNALNGVLANDTNPSHLSLTAVLLTGPSHGTLHLNADGSFSYVANGGFSGTDTFTYKDTSGLVSSNAATVSITVDTTPVIVGVPSLLPYVEGQPPIILSPESFAYHDTGFTGSTLTVSLVGNGTSTDILSVVPSNAVTVLNHNIFYNGIDIGSYAGGTNSAALVLTFNSSATATSVSEVMEQIGFSNTSHNPSTLTRTIHFQLTDNVGDKSNTLTDTVNIYAPPIIGATSTSLTLHTNSTVGVGGTSMAGLSVSDATNNGLYSVSLQVKYGDMNFTSLSGLSNLQFTNGAPGKSGSETLNFQGSLSDINLALSRLTYTSNTGFTGTDDIAITVESTIGGGVQESQDNIFLHVVQ